MRTSLSIDRALVTLAMLAIAGAAVALAAMWAEPAAATASCVAVVVDARQVGGSVQTGCAQGDPANGLQALSRAGFGVTPRARDGLICQIDARPACAATTSTTYWSYWYRAAGSTQWVYASAGPGTHNPKPGSTEGWVWQDGGKTPPPPIRAEAVCPQLAAAPSATPKPTHPPSSKPAATPNGNASRASSTQAPTSARPAPGKRGSSSPAAASTSLTPLAATQQPSGGGSTDRSAGGPDDQSGGVLDGVAGAALGGAVAVGIGAVTVIRVRRDRSP